MAYHFGWDIEKILSLTPIQFSMVMDGLSEILKQKYDPDYKDDVKKEALMMASVQKAKNILAKKGKGKLNLSDL